MSPYLLEGENDNFTALSTHKSHNKLKHDATCVTVSLPLLLLLLVIARHMQLQVKTKYRLITENSATISTCTYQSLSLSLLLSLPVTGRNYVKSTTASDFESHLLSFG